MAADWYRPCALRDLLPFIDLCKWSSLKFVFSQQHNHVSASCDTSSGPGARGELWSISWLSLHTWTVNQGGQQQGSMGYERRSCKGGGYHNVENVQVSRRTSPIFTKINKIFTGLRNKILGRGFDDTLWRHNVHHTPQWGSDYYLVIISVILLYLRLAGTTRNVTDFWPVGRSLKFARGSVFRETSSC